MKNREVRNFPPGYEYRIYVLNKAFAVSSHNLKRALHFKVITYIRAFLHFGKPAPLNDNTAQVYCLPHLGLQ